MRSRICKCCGERMGDHRNICASCESMEDERDAEKGKLRQEIANDDVILNRALERNHEQTRQ